MKHVARRRGSLRKWSLWRTLLAGAVIGLVEAAGLDPRRAARRRPLRVVWIDHRGPDDPLARAGVWFLDPLGDPRPALTDLRRPAFRGLRLVRIPRARIFRALSGSGN